jgi:cell growth-regulating nucleolar protein
MKMTRGGEGRGGGGGGGEGEEEEEEWSMCLRYDRKEPYLPKRNQDGKNESEKRKEKANRENENVVLKRHTSRIQHR